MLTNSAYHLLRKMKKGNYSFEHLSKKQKITLNDDIQMLLEHSYVEYFITSYNNKWGYPDNIDYKITPAGIAFIQNKRHELFSKWVPYIITTIISIIALINSILARLGL